MAVCVLVLLDRVPWCAELPDQRQPVYAAGRAEQRGTGTYGAVNYGLLLAGAVIAMIPCIIVYTALQRYYVRGLVSGALKG